MLMDNLALLLVIRQDKLDIFSRWFCRHPMDYLLLRNFEFSLPARKKNDAKIYWKFWWPFLVASDVTMMNFHLSKDNMRKLRNKVVFWDSVNCSMFLTGPLSQSLSTHVLHTWQPQKGTCKHKINNFSFNIYQHNEDIKAGENENENYCLFVHVQILMGQCWRTGHLYSCDVLIRIR